MIKTKAGRGVDMDMSIKKFVEIMNQNNNTIFEDDVIKISDNGSTAIFFVVDEKTASFESYRVDYGK